MEAGIQFAKPTYFTKRVIKHLEDWIGRRERKIDREALIAEALRRLGINPRGRDIRKLIAGGERSLQLWWKPREMDRFLLVIDEINEFRKIDKERGDEVVEFIIKLLKDQDFSALDSVEHLLLHKRVYNTYDTILDALDLKKNLGNRSTMSLTCEGETEEESLKNARRLLGLVPRMREIMKSKKSAFNILEDIKRFGLEEGETFEEGLRKAGLIQS
jgi:hypothetical protein